MCYDKHSTDVLLSYPLRPVGQEHSMLDLTFYLGKNMSKGGLQWKADETDGHRTVVYVPDTRSALQPSSVQKHFKCSAGRTVFQNEAKTFVIIAVDLIEAIEDKVVEPGLVENQDETDDEVLDVEYDFALEFMRGKHPKTRMDQWQASVYDKDAEFTTLYVVDNASPVVPKMNGEMYAAVFSKEIYHNEEKGFAIVIVKLVVRLYPEDLFPRESGIAGSIRPSRHGRSADKREMDRQRRASMKTNTGGGKKKSA